MSQSRSVQENRNYSWYFKQKELISKVLEGLEEQKDDEVERVL